MTEVLRLLMSLIKSFETFITNFISSIPWLDLKNRSSRLQYAIIAGLVSAIIVHIVYLFFIPHVEKYNAWNALKKNSPEYQFTEIEDDNHISKATDPLFSIKACRFNLNDGPVHLYAEGTTTFWSLSIYNREGLNYYSINDRTTPNDILDLVIATPAQIMQLRQASIEFIANSVLVNQDIGEGFVILRSYDGQNNNEKSDFLNEASCESLSN